MQTKQDRHEEREPRLSEQELHQPRDYGIKLFGAGVVGVIILLGLYSLMWRGRLRGSVNQAIYDRQISST